MIEFFDRAGRATAFCDDRRALFLWNGRPAGFIHDERVYAYSGRFIGWFEDGWISDADGSRLLFEFDAVGGPDKPKREARPVAGPRAPKPPKGAMEPAPERRTLGSSWSERSFSELI